MLFVLAHQKDCWDYLINKLWKNSSFTTGTVVYVGADSSISKHRSATNVDALYKDAFGDCEDPKPSEYNFHKLIQYYNAGEDMPEYIEYSARDKADPEKIAAEIIKDDLTESRQNELIAKRYELPLAKAIYSSLDDYQDAINKWKRRQLNPQDFHYPPVTKIHFQPLSSKRPTPPPEKGYAHNLSDLMELVIERGKSIVTNNPKLRFLGQLEWTDRFIETWFGKAYWNNPNYKHGKIRINRLLNTPDISSEAIQFLLWHEFLHVYLEQNHTEEFKQYERKWPTFKESNLELDRFPEKYQIRSKFWY